MKTIIIVIVFLVLSGCGKESVVEPVQSDNVVNRYSGVVILGRGEERVIDGSVINIYGWNYVDIHSTGVIELRFNSQETILGFTDFTVAGVRVENMILVNHGHTEVTISLVIKGN